MSCTSLLDPIEWPCNEVPTILCPFPLRSSASRIRDILDPLVAREGPNALLPEDVLAVHNLLAALRKFAVPQDVIRFSRIHFAVADICGKATRWPTSLAERADVVTRRFEAMFGPIKELRPPLFEMGGRLWGICGMELSNKVRGCLRGVGEVREDVLLM